MALVLAQLLLMQVTPDFKATLLLETTRSLSVSQRPSSMPMATASDALVVLMPCIEKHDVLNPSELTLPSSSAPWLATHPCATTTPIAIKHSEAILFMTNQLLSVTFGAVYCSRHAGRAPQPRTREP